MGTHWHQCRTLLVLLCCAVGAQATMPWYNMCSAPKDAVPDLYLFDRSTRYTNNGKFRFGAPVVKVIYAGKLKGGLPDGSGAMWYPTADAGFEWLKFVGEFENSKMISDGATLLKGSAVKAEY